MHAGKIPWFYIIVSNCHEDQVLDHGLRVLPLRLLLETICNAFTTINLTSRNLNLSQVITQHYYSPNRNYFENESFRKSLYTLPCLNSYG